MKIKTISISICALILTAAIYANARVPANSASRQTITSSPSPSTSASVSPSPNASASGSPALATLNNTEAANLIHHINALEIQQSLTAESAVQLVVTQEIAQSFVTGHEAQETLLLSAAATADVPIYAFQAATYEEAVNAQLAQLPSADADSAFIETQLQGHERALSALQGLVSVTTDPNILSVLNSEISMVQAHIAVLTSAQNGTYTPSPSPSVSASASPSPSPSSTAASSMK